MIRDELLDLSGREPFEPFRIKLVNGDFYNVFDPLSLAIQAAGVTIAASDGGWVVFPFDKINSIESLIEDYIGRLDQP